MVMMIFISAPMEKIFFVAQRTYCSLINTILHSKNKQWNMVLPIRAIPRKLFFLIMTGMGTWICTWPTILLITVTSVPIILSAAITAEDRLPMINYTGMMAIPYTWAILFLPMLVYKRVLKTMVMD